MQSAFKPLLRAAVFYLLSVLAIAVVLVTGNYLVEGIRGALSARDKLQAVASVHDELLRYRDARASAVVDRLAAARKLPLAAVDARIRTVGDALRSAVPEDEDALTGLFKGGPGEYAQQLAGRYKQRLDRELLAQELAYLQQLRAHLVALDKQALAIRERQRLLERHRAVHARLMAKRAEQSRLGPIDALRMQYPWARGPALDRLARDIAALTAENARAAAAYRAQDAALRRLPAAQGLRDFALDWQGLERVLLPLEEQLAEARLAVARDPLARLAAPLLRALPLACAILVLCLAGRAGIRAFFYFVLAPLATRAAPVRLDQARQAGQAGQGGAVLELLSPSAVSQAIALAPHEELLVLPHYLQSVPVAAGKSTRWLIRGRWWASLVSGMALLTCVRTRSVDDPVVLSSSDDGLSEIAIVRIPAGRALALHPRALVGLVADAGTPPDIRWHWRLDSLHAWLTLQLRFFVLRGPLTLAVQGTRGVRVQPARGVHASRQAATLGFSTDVAYSTVRSAPFLPYLRGQNALLNDRFEGSDGIYLYDETPRAGRKAGRVGRGLEGITDTLLKLFGY
ncbi:hypothetical protein [Massilia sp.]|uniref:hypothetical protein n=1 Tax=Massilia sp. TaxID=1882437 RepID=UPI0028AC72F2|nr:hypothetical protein [Massilia sp.]